MLFESLLFFILAVTCFFLIVLPAIQILKKLFPPKRDALEEAKVRLGIAQKEAEAARLNKEAEKVYSNLYAETLVEEDDDEEENVTVKKGSRKR